MKTIRPYLTTLLLAAAFGLSLLLLSSASLHAEPIRLTENLRGETVILPPSAPDKEGLALVSFFTIAPEAEIIAALSAYDDPQTGRPVDYIEFFDGAGNLLMVSWLDRFGIRSTAIDQGILQKEGLGLQGILVLLLEGIPV